MLTGRAVGGCPSLLLGLALLGAVQARASEGSLDHLILAVPDLEAYVAEFAATTAVEPTFGGAHPALGTANYLVAVGDGAYLEILGPDPSLDEPLGLGRTLVALAEPTLAWFALGSLDIESTARRLREAGLEILGPSPGTRRLPDGRELAWDAILVTGHEFGDFVPFFIDWGSTRHPASSAVTGLRLVEFSVEHPRAEALNRLYGEIGLAALARPSTLPGFAARLAFEGGELLLSNHYREQIFAPLMGAPAREGSETP